MPMVVGILMVGDLQSPTLSRGIASRPPNYRVGTSCDEGSRSHDYVPSDCGAVGGAAEGVPERHEPNLSTHTYLSIENNHN
jgi:hypothetical protein